MGDIILAMIKFMYLGKIILDHGEDEIRRCEEAMENVNEFGDDGSLSDHGLDGLSLDCADIELDDSKVEIQEEIKCEEEDADEEEEEDSESSISGLSSRETASSAFKKKEESVDADLNELKLNCPEAAQKLFGLFQIAECYEIEELIVACCHKFRSHITVQTGCIFLIYLDKYTHLNEIKKIKNCILDFIVSNIKQIKLSNGYLYMLQNKPSLLDELIT